MFLAAAGCFVVPFTLGPETFGVLLGLGEAGTFRGAGPIVDVAESREHEGGGEGNEVTLGGGRAS